MDQLPWNNSFAFASTNEGKHQSNHFLLISLSRSIIKMCSRVPNVKGIRSEFSESHEWTKNGAINNNNKKMLTHKLAAQNGTKWKWRKVSDTELVGYVGEHLRICHIILGAHMVDWMHFRNVLIASCFVRCSGKIDNKSPHQIILQLYLPFPWTNKRRIFTSKNDEKRRKIEVQ